MSPRAPSSAQPRASPERAGLAWTPFVAPNRILESAVPRFHQTDPSRGHLGVPLEGLAQHPRGQHQRAELRELVGRERRDEALGVRGRRGTLEDQDDIVVAEERLVSSEPVLGEVERRAERGSAASTRHAFPVGSRAMTATRCFLIVFLLVPSSLVADGSPSPPGMPRSRYGQPASRRSGRRCLTGRWFLEAVSVDS